MARGGEAVTLGDAYLRATEALRERVGGALTGAEPALAERQRALRAAVLLAVARALLEEVGADPDTLRTGDLDTLGGAVALPPALAAAAAAFARAEAGAPPRTDLERALRRAHRIGEALDLLVALDARQRRAGDARAERRRSGSYFTPHAVARSVVERALERSSLAAAAAAPGFVVLDPAVGGGAFLLEAAAALVRAGGRGEAPAERRRVAALLRGVDESPIAVSVTEIALWLFVEERGAPLGRPGQLARGDSLLDARAPFADVSWLVGNPPWVAFQGRAAQPLPPAVRAEYRRRYAAFRGYPTLQGLFVQRATELAPRGVIALLLPSSVSDLDGYASCRAALRATHEPAEPLLEYGQDAFPGVVQPCFGLVATPRRAPPAADEDRSRPWVLAERARLGGDARTVGVPTCLSALERRPPLPPMTFGELGLQSNRRVSAELFRRAAEPSAPFVEPLLEGKNVQEFREDPPGLFLHPDASVLGAARCRLRPLADYARAALVVRQTAAYTIAALHGGLRFRNSLLAGYARPDLPGELLVGLLNSALYRALHLSLQRDARQAAFPQVKIRHLRALPAPPDDGAARARVQQIAAAATRGGGLTRAAREALDRAVFDLFALPTDGRAEVLAFLRDRAPRALEPSLP